MNHKKLSSLCIHEQSAQQLLNFRDERDWKQFHNPKDLAISLSLEAAELLEIFQWSQKDLYCTEKKEQIKEELADVLCYALLMADACDLNLDEILADKIAKNKEKYPVEKAKGLAKKYSELK